MTQPVRIAIVGDYNPDSSHHVATNEALTHTAEFLSIPLESPGYQHRHYPQKGPKLH